jgi:hypothetical protein
MVALGSLVDVLICPSVANITRHRSSVLATTTTLFYPLTITFTGAFRLSLLFHILCALPAAESLHSLTSPLR